MRVTLPTGTLIADRFEIERVAGSGGMGTVYRAYDRQRSEWVALKMLHKQSGTFLETRRFAREARILSELRHPGIVSYVDSGQSREGQSYLVMEWLEGEDLAQRMERGRLTVPEARQLLERVAAALSCAHSACIIHRDIKPSNLFLCNKQFTRVVLLDFGVAHYERPTTRSALTLAGAVVGTLEYMAPEQARADNVIDAAADIYSLGRVVYQGISGRMRRMPEHVAAALARTIFEQDPPLRQICPWVPDSISGLLCRMLAKDPGLRPVDGGELLAELSMLGPISEAPIGEASLQDPLHGANSEEEQSLYSVVLAVPATMTPSGEESLPTDALRADMTTRRELENVLLAQGAHLDWLLDGSLLLTLLPSDSAHDQAAQAARCALIIKTYWPNSAVALATGRGQVTGRAVIGEVVDRTARLLRDRHSIALRDPKVAAVERGGIWVDGLSASLLERRFVLVTAESVALLTGELTSQDEARPVLGKHTPCLGREQELTILEAILYRCREDSEAQAALITALPGMGKTRLRQEFLTRLRRRSRPTIVLSGVGEVLSAGTPYALIGQGLRRMCGIGAGVDPELARERLLTRCTDLMGAETGTRVTPYLAEVCGLGFSEKGNSALRIGHGDLRNLPNQVLNAFVEFLGAWCERTTVLLVLDDLHWGDMLTIQLVDGLLRELRNRPLMVLALARPEIKTTFPKVRHWPSVKEIPLDGLSRSASERLVLFVLGDSVKSEVVNRIAQQAAGNALLLEELIRAENERQGEQLPETVIAILQARMQRLDPRARLVLGKASLFGQRFWRGGIQAILDNTTTQIELDIELELQALVQAELITRHKQSCYPGDAEYSFRHTLMREAAYSLLVDEQKRRWHRVAGQYLERMGETDPLMLAEHFGHSDKPYLAVPYFVRAAATALDGNDWTGTRACVERGLSCMTASHTDEDARGELLGIEAIALARTSELEACFRVGEEALRLLPAGGVRWCQILYTLLMAAVMRGRQDSFAVLSTQLLGVEPAAEAMATYLEAGGILLGAYSLSGQRQAALAFLARMENLAHGISDRQPGAKAWLRFGQQRMLRMLDGDPFLAWKYAEEAAAAALQSGNRRFIGIMRGDAVLAELELGGPAGPGGKEKLQEVLAILELGEIDVSQGWIAASATLWLSGQSAHAAEAAEMAKSVLSRYKGNELLCGMAHWALSRAYLSMGMLPMAEREALWALWSLETLLAMQLGALAQLLWVRLAAGGRLEEVCSVAVSARTQLAALQGVGFMDLNLRLALIEVALQCGQREEAHAELRLALSILKARAERIPDALWQKRYLENIFENQRLIALAEELLGENPTASLGSSLPAPASSSL